MKNIIKKILKFLGIEELHYMTKEEFEVTIRAFFPNIMFFYDGWNDSTCMLLTIDDEIWIPVSIEYRDGIIYESVENQIHRWDCGGIEHFIDHLKAINSNVGGSVLVVDESLYTEMEKDSKAYEERENAQGNS